MHTHNTHERFSKNIWDKKLKRPVKIFLFLIVRMMGGEFLL
jgi:hypothetical protein